MPDSKLVIDGQEYLMPDFSEMTMGDARLLKRYTGRTLEELQTASPSDPDFIAALCHLAIMRSEPGATFDQIEGKVNAIQFAKLEFIGAEDEQSPPASIQNGSANVVLSSGETSGERSDETPVTSLRPTGMQG